MLRYVCDRCKKVIPKDDQFKSTRLTIKKNRPDKDQDIDLCSDCTKLFNIFMLNEDDSDDPVEMPLAEDGFECPRCFTHYNFSVTDEDRRIHVLRIGSHKVEEGYIDRPFVNFNCSVCNLLLKIPKVVLEEVNK